MIKRSCEYIRQQWDNRSYTFIDLFAPVWIITGIVLCIKALVPWCVFILILLSNIRLPITKWHNRTKPMF